MKNLFYFLTLMLFSTQTVLAQHYYDDAFTAQRADSYTIDGVGDEAFWSLCTWYDLEYIWIPYGTSMSSSDFTGRVKFAWTEEKLLVLAEIEDDVLSDVHADPQDNYWNDDCFEVFLDEDYSGGWHQTSYNAFAYHCSINEDDVIDSGDDDAYNVYVNDHVDYDLDTIDATHYVWELAITIYDDTYDESNATNTTVNLATNKEMGIAVAYCDNDGGSTRENFIGLINVAAEHYNSAWQDADVFGKLTLANADPLTEEITAAEEIRIFSDRQANMVIENYGTTSGMAIVSLFDMNGRLIREQSIYMDGRNSIDVSALEKGLYILRLKGETIGMSKMIHLF